MLGQPRRAAAGRRHRGRRDPVRAGEPGRSAGAGPHGGRHALPGRPGRRRGVLDRPPGLRGRARGGLRRRRRGLQAEPQHRDGGDALGLAGHDAGDRGGHPGLARRRQRPDRRRGGKRVLPAPARPVRVQERPAGDGRGAAADQAHDEGRAVRRGHQPQREPRRKRERRRRDRPAGQPRRDTRRRHLRPGHRLHLRGQHHRLRVPAGRRQPGPDEGPDQRVPEVGRQGAAGGHRQAHASRSAVPERPGPLLPHGPDDGGVRAHRR